MNFIQGKRIIVLAQTFKSLSEVLFAEITTRLNEMGIQYHFDRTAMKITYGDGVIYGASYENLESIRGFTNISIAICDEAALAPTKLFATLAPCLRGEGIDPYIRLLSTPRRGSWLNLYVKEHADSVEIITAKTVDNKLITQDQIEMMKSAISNEELLKQELEGVILDIDSDSSIVQLSDYAKVDSGKESDANYLGIDLAGLGCDNNVLVVSNKYRVEQIVKIQKANSFELLNEVEKLIQRYNIKHTCIDITGSTSCGLFDMMNQKEYSVEGINFAQKPYNERYCNARCEMYTELSQAIKNGMFLDNEDIKTQLAYTTIFVNNSGKFQLCKKDDIKAVIGHSPDEADALALSVYASNHSNTTAKEAKHASEVAARYAYFFKQYN